MKIRRIVYTEYKPDCSDKSAKRTEWQAFCDVCRLKTGQYGSIEEAVQAFKDFDFVNCDDYDYYDEEGR